MPLGILTQRRFIYSRLSHFSRAAPDARGARADAIRAQIPQILAASHVVRRTPCMKSTAGTNFLDFSGADCASTPESLQVRWHAYNRGLHVRHGNFGPSRRFHAVEPPVEARSRSYLRIIDGWDQNCAISRCHFPTVPTDTAGQERAYIRPAAISHPRNGPGHRFHASPRYKSPST